MTEHADGTTILHAGSSIDYLKTPYNKEKTLSFQKLVRPIFNRIISIKNENLKLVKTRDILLPKLMSGEIEVPYE
jgi:type I restriction enzyme S subunit